MSYAPSQPPKHRAAHRAPTSSRRSRVALRTALSVSALAAVATGLVVGGSMVLGEDGEASVDITSSRTSEPGGSATIPVADALSAVPDLDREPLTTRSQSRVSGATEADPLKTDALTLDSGNALSRAENLSGEDPRTIARALLAEFGFGQDQFGCLDSLWTRESNWNPFADNPRSSAYGIPQALPGSKMSSAGADWATNPVTQIRWGLGYIAGRYGTPCSAWGHSQSRGYY